EVGSLLQSGAACAAWRKELTAAPRSSQASLPIPPLVMRPTMLSVITPRRLLAAGAAIPIAALAATPAFAHVKWFAPYIVDAPPMPVGATLTNVWFWTAIALVLVFFLATRFLEERAIGQAVTAGL